MAEPGTVFTIGHSTHEIDAFLGLLTRHGITAVADVRSTPASRFNPQFNRDTIRSSLAKADVGYVFLGRELGARSEDRDCYVDGRVQYARLAEAPAYKDGLARLEAGRVEHRIAIMCSEGDPLDCHRSVLISESLLTCGVPIVHILSSGRLETHQEIRMRLRALHGFSEEDLLHSANELTAKALARQEEKIAYVYHESREEVTD
jgi:uncharacterized protein (DUF488 family)